MARNSLGLPKDDNEAIKDIEAITDVPEKSVSNEFQEHFDCKNNAENQVANFHRSCQNIRLVVEFNAHTEGIGQDTAENEPLEPIVIDKQFHVLLNG